MADVKIIQAFMG